MESEKDIRCGFLPVFYSLDVLKMKINLFTALVIVVCCGITVLAQAEKNPSISEKDLEKLTYYFEIVDDKLVGDGARFLTDEMNKSQYVLLGEYHYSLQISKFTKSVIPVLHDAGFRTFGLEIGPVTAEILSGLSKDSTRTVECLNAFNSQYQTKTPNRTLPPIPFFDGIEDADFLIEARKRNWNLIGLDQEFFIGYIPLIDRMYDNLAEKKKKELKDLHAQVIKQIENLTKNYYLGNDKKLYTPIYESKEINQYLESASDKNPKNKKIADEFRATTVIYRYNELQRYYDNNNERALYMKKNLVKGFSNLKFDLKKDKMLLKMGGLHTSRGLSLFDISDIGNILSELATFNGNHSLHIGFGSRYYIKDGKEIDALETPKDRPNRSQDLLQMGKKDKWVIIDLRKLRPAVFSSLFNFNPTIRQTILGKDLYIIAPTDKNPTPNYVLRK